MGLKTLFRRFTHGMEPRVFLPAAAVVVAFGAIFTDTARSPFSNLQSSIVETFGYAAAGLRAPARHQPLPRFPAGRQRLEARSQCAAWFSMLLSAGIGISGNAWRH